MKKISNLIIWIFFYVFIFSFLLYNSFSYLDPDLGTHLRIGEKIIENKEIPHIITFDYPIEGQRWVDHEWLMKIISFGIFDKLGYLALNIFFALIIIAVLIIINIFIHKNYLKNKNEFLFILIFQLFGVIAISPHCGIRMQEITLLFLLSEIIIIHAFNKSKNRKLLFGLIPLFYFWANCHAGFLLGLAVLGFFVFIKILELLIYKYYQKSFFNFSQILTRKEILVFCLFSFLSFLATLATPYKLELYSFLTDYTNTYYLKHINEWLPQYHYPFNYWQISYIAVITAFAGITIATAIKEKKPHINIWQFGLTTVFIYLAIESKRHFPLLFIASFPFLMYALINFMKLPKNFLNKNTLAKKIFYFYLIVSLALLSGLYLIKINFTKDPFISFSRNYPYTAINYLKNNRQYDDLNILNPYDWGSYMTWVYPERKIFIDGRFSQFKFEGQTLLEEYHSFFDPKKISEKIKKHNIKLVLLDNRKKEFKVSWLDKFFGIKTDKLNNQENHLKNYLEESENWKNIYSDNISIIYKYEN